MRYLVVGEAHNDCNIFEFDSKNQAIRYADILYANMCRYDKLHYENLYVLRSVNPPLIFNYFPSFHYYIIIFDNFCQF